MSSKISDGLGPTGIRGPYSPTENQKKNCEIALAIFREQLTELGLSIFLLNSIDQ
jgi:hypothetical protein